MLIHPVTGQRQYAHADDYGMSNREVVIVRPVCYEIEKSGASTARHSAFRDLMRANNGRCTVAQALAVGYWPGDLDWARERGMVVIGGVPSKSQKRRAYDWYVDWSNPLAPVHTRR